MIIRKLLVFLLVVIFQCSDSSQISFDLRFSDVGYWYAKACNNDSLFSEITSFDAWYDFQQFNNPAELQCFFEQSLRSNHPVLKRLKFLNYIEKNKLQIPNDDISSIQHDLKILRKYFYKSSFLFEKIASFYGAYKKIKLHIFFSRPDKGNHAQGLCLDNFSCHNELHALILMSEPPLSNKKLSIANRIGIIAHEFSHSMLEATFGNKENFESLVVGTKEPNAIFVSWVLNEALATVLGNIITHGKISEKDVDWTKEEYCTYGFANALKPMTEKYLSSNRSIDIAYIKSAIKIFNYMFPDCINDPRFFLRRYTLISEGDGRKEAAYLMSKIQCDCFETMPFPSTRLLKIEVEKINADSKTVIVAYSNKKQLQALSGILPKFDIKKTINFILKNNRLWIIIKVDAQHPFEKQIDLILKKNIH